MPQKITMITRKKALLAHSTNNGKINRRHLPTKNNKALKQGHFAPSYAQISLSLDQAKYQDIYLINAAKAF